LYRILRPLIAPISRSLAERVELTSRTAASTFFSSTSSLP
jgi:hypothetical protein